MLQVPSVDASVDVPSVSGGAGVEGSLPSASADLQGEFNPVGWGAGGRKYGGGTCPCVRVSRDGLDFCPMIHISMIPASGRGAARGFRCHIFERLNVDFACSMTMRMSACMHQPRRASASASSSVSLAERHPRHTA